MCGAEGNLSCDMAPDRLVPSMTAFEFDPGHGAEHVSDRAAGHRNQDRLGARTSPCLRHESASPRFVKYRTRRLRENAGRGRRRHNGT